MVEVWKNIPGYNGYRASSLGRIKSVGKLYKTRYGTTAIKKDKIFKQNHVRKDGYKSVCITVDGNQKTILSHILVCLAFHEKIHGKEHVNHINATRSDNRPENLEWCNRSENTKHSFKLGIQCNKGARHPGAKLTDEDILFIRNNRAITGEPYYLTAKRLGLSKTTVMDICNRKTWSHI